MKHSKGRYFTAAAIIAIILWLIAIACMLGMFDGLANWKVEQ